MLTAVAGFIFVGIIQCAFLLGLRSGIAALILIRPICDRIFELGRFEFAGSEISGGALINLVVIIVTMLNAQSIVRSMPAGLRTTWLPFVLVTFAAVLYSPLPIGGFRKFLTYVSFAAVFLLAFLVVKTEQDLRHYLKLIVLSSAVPVLYGLFQAVTGIDAGIEGHLDARINKYFLASEHFRFLSGNNYWSHTLPACRKQRGCTRPYPCHPASLSTAYPRVARSDKNQECVGRLFHALFGIRCDIRSTRPYRCPSLPVFGASCAGGERPPHGARQSR